MIGSISRSQAAAELGVSDDWLRRNWERLVLNEGMPAPIAGGRHNQDTQRQMWKAAQFYAWLDRNLPEEQRVAAASFRAAAHAFLVTQTRGIDPDDVDIARIRLDKRFEGKHL